jgi:NAD(P)-dependent dehydrogenase (short-subunit alcohol dehydrogenase family)
MVPLSGGHDVVVVTGGSMGIGFACADAVLAAGARVVLAARGAAALERAREALARTHGAGRVRACRCDVSVESDVDGLFAEASGFGRLGGVVHAAAVIGPIGAVTDTEPAAWLDAVRIDLFGTYLVLRAAAASLRESGGGRIVLLSGGGAAAPFPNYSAYACSKAAVVRLAETAAHELAAHGIAVNALAPGFVATRMHDATLAAGERAGTDYLARTKRELAAGGVPADLAAQAAVFLLSEASAGITGRLFAAGRDDAASWRAHVREIAAGDLFTLRRIVPRDRGGDWQ